MTEDPSPDLLRQERLHQGEGHVEQVALVDDVDLAKPDGETVLHQRDDLQSALC